MLDILIAFPFFMHACIAGIGASITGGIIGSYVVVKRIVFISGSIAHSVLGGMGLFLWIKRTQGWDFFDPLYGALLAAILSAFLIGYVHLRYREREDTVIAAMWSTGMALGVIFVSFTPGYNVELMNFLFGNILWISSQDLILITGLTLLIVLLSWLFHAKFQAVCFDETEAALRGISVKRYYLLLLNLVAVSVVILIQVVGAILVIALLAIPAAIASRLSNTLSLMMGKAVLLGASFIIAGLVAAFALNWPPGATMALVAAVVYMAHLFRT